MPMPSIAEMLGNAAPTQRSLVGSPLYGAAPGQYYDDTDMARRQMASQIEDKAWANPAFGNRNARAIGNPRSPDRNYLASGLAYDVEGLLSAVAQKYGANVAVQLLHALPTMSKDQLMQLQQQVQGAASEAQAMDDRERMVYERAGALGQAIGR